MKQVRYLVATLFINLLFLVGFMIPATTVSAHHCFGHVGQGEVSIAECADAGACLDTSGTGCPAQSSAEGRVNSVIKLIINLFSFIVGVVAVIMVIIGGFKYVTSSGDANNITSAKNTILYAIVGLIIVALAQVIVRFVLSKAAGTTTTFLSLIG